ncbi:hypothetical protein [Acerihabitans arboris]|uniref:Lipoprotein n=1 Tax=Acerihabitans arboris TaxID=2691583 RepID=A0A845SRI9_9GAMM|nr:hypothetical protein [Acerihabitans arboris]NDL63745.1 hypothetical protein [Acerihabitans arboris]
MNKSITLASLVFFIMFSSGCAYFSGSPGEKPSDTSPKISTPPGQKQYWNNASLFGPVPNNLKKEGDKKCAMDGNGEAIGYHPRPKKYDGSYFSGPGYLCLMI